LNELQLLSELCRRLGPGGQFVDRLPMREQLEFAVDGLQVVAKRENQEEEEAET
jgi:hypothetical protein